MKKKKSKTKYFTKDIDLKIAKATQYLQSGQFSRAEEIYKKIPPNDPLYPYSLCMRGIILFQRKIAEPALALIKKAIRLEPGNPVYYYNLGLILKEEGQTVKAVSCLQKALKLNPSDHEILNNLANLLAADGKYKEAVVLLQRALASTTTHKAEVLNNLAKAYEGLGDYDNAVTCLEKALEIKPSDDIIIATLAGLYENLNQVDKANELAQEGLSVAPHNVSLNITAARCQRRLGKLEEAIRRLSRFDDRVAGESPNIYYELGKIYDKLGDSSQAFQFFKKGNNARLRQCSKNEILRGEAKQYVTFIDRQIEYFNRGKIILLDQTHPQDLRMPYFLIGFPRSGTTLLHQILTSHQGMETLHEENIAQKLKKRACSLYENYCQALEKLTQEEVHMFASEYFKSAERVLGKVAQGQQIIDVHPSNTAYVGLLWRIFPKAKFIFAARHPYDVCLSCFMQNFNVNTATAHFFTLEDTAEYYRKTMTLWFLLLENLPVQTFHMHYEDLITDFESQCRRMLDFMEVPWDENILNYHQQAKKQKLIKTASYHQVAEPIYQHARYRWQRYEEFLEPVREKLAPVIEHFGYAER